MNNKEFFTEWDGKPYHYDTAFGNECADLFKGHSRDVHGKTINVALGAAKNYYKDSNKWGGIKTPQPVEGDYAFTTYTEWGHVGIFVKIDTNPLFFWQFDQLGNGPVVGGEKPCKMRKYRIKDLLGYVTYNKPTMEEPKMPLEELRKIWKECKTRRFNDYTIDERTKYLIDISFKK